MFNQALNINKSQDNKNSEYTEEDYDLINKDISKALSDMKNENMDQDEDNNNNDENENEDDIDYFHKDFFSDSSNSISNDNFSDISEHSFKSANISMRNNSIKKNIMNDNININPFINTEIPDNQKSNFLKKNEISKKELNYNNNLLNNNINIIQKNLYNNMSNPSIQNNNLNSINNLSKTPHFNNNNFNINIVPNQFIGNNNKITNMNHNINNNNNFFQINNNQPLFNANMNNFPININPNLNNQIFNNNMINNTNLLKPISNNYLNNASLGNNNMINYNNNWNNKQIFMNEKKNNSFTSYPVISERGVPGLYNLDSPKNIINLENILRNRDKRTTLIIRNIPNKYTINLLLKELNQNFENKFDIVYLPQDYINNSNLGFGFINFVNSMHLLLFYEEFVNKKWNFFNSKKRCNLAYSKYQGKNELIKYILNKLGISTLDNNSENIRKSFYINNNKNLRAPIEIPIKYYGTFVSYHPYSFCRYKNDKIFIVDKYYNI